MGDQDQDTEKDQKMSCVLVTWSCLWEKYTLLVYVSSHSQLVGPTSCETHQLWDPHSCEWEEVYTRNRVYFLLSLTKCFLFVEW